MPKKKPDVRGLSNYLRALPCDLTDAEILVYAADLARIVQDIEAEVDRQASIRNELKAKLTALQAQRIALAGIIARKEEYRDVKVNRILDFKANKYREIREDTGVIIVERDIRDEERQAKLPLEKPAKKPICEDDF